MDMAAVNPVAEQSSSIKETILSQLNEQQRLPVVDYKGPSIILAGAGAGKTHTIVSRTAYMIEDGIPARNILLFTFTRKGANEIKERVAMKIAAKSKGITIGTYHSFCARLLRQYIDFFGIWDNKFSIFDAEDCLQILKKLSKGYSELKGTKPAVIQSLISRWKERMLSPQEAAVDAAQADGKMIKAVAEVYANYSLELKKNNAVDFDDLIYLVIELFEQFPEIKAKINEKYHYIVADESQDSSPRDLELIYHLGGDRMNICLVGDDYQSIYGFRGSDIDAYFTFVDELKLKKFYLDQNYRSTQTIVAAAQSVVDHNTKQFPKSLFSENAEGGAVICYSLPDEKVEANQVVKIVKTLLKHDVKPSEIAVLYRMTYLSRKVEDAFILNNIKYRMLSGTPFYGRMEVKDVMAFMRLLVNANDWIAFERSFKRPKRGIGEASLAKIKACITDNECAIMTLDDLIKVLKDLDFKGKKRDSVLNWCGLMQDLVTASQHAKPAELIELFLAASGYLEFLKDEDEESFDDRKKNINELLNIAAGYDSLVDFVGNMIVNEADTEESQDEDSVNMLTIHASKGLEYRAVIIVGCNQNTIPHFRAINDGDISEERRLFYVAMTRAKEFLFLTRAKTVYNRGEAIPCNPSVFIQEIDKKYIRKI